MTKPSSKGSKIHTPIIAAIVIGLILLSPNMIVPYVHAQPPTTSKLMMGKGPKGIQPLYTNFGNSGGDKGCNGASEFWSVSGQMPTPPTSGFWLSNNYPSSLSTGVYPFCSSPAWQSLSLTLHDYTGNWLCVGTFNVSSVNPSTWYECPGKTVNSGDFVEIDATGNYANGHSTSPLTMTFSAS